MILHVPALAQIRARVNTQTAVRCPNIRNFRQTVRCVSRQLLFQREAASALWATWLTSSEAAKQIA
jgi:hypothetical protein